MSAIREDPSAATSRTIWQSLERSAELYGDREAIVSQDSRVTYKGMLEHVDRLAAGLLSRGIQPGDHVAIVFPATPEWVYVHYALTTIGAVAVPINFNYKSEEARWVLKQGDVDSIITVDSMLSIDILDLFKSVDPALQPGDVNSEQFPLIKRMFVLESNAESGSTHSLRPLLAHGISEDEKRRLAAIRAKQTPDDACYIIFTSGSTARPKPALIPQRAVSGVGRYYAAAMDLGEEDRFLAALTTFHIGGPVCIAAPHSVGASTHLIGVFDPGVILETCERERCTASGGFDTMFTKIMGHPDFGKRDISSFKKCFIACSPSYHDELRRAFKLDILAATYGCTEAAGAITFVMPDETDPEIRRSSNGRPHPGLEIRIVDPETGQAVSTGTPGELCFRGWSKFLGYYKMPEENAAAIDAEGFVHMGDYGFVDEKGYFYYRGRYKMMVKTGGENVSEKEVEIFLEDAVPSVEFAQVVGVPDPVWGEAVVAFVQLRPGISITPEEIREQCRGKIAGFKIPKHVWILEAQDWPILPVGRPDKHTLRKMAAERLGRAEVS